MKSLNFGVVIACLIASTVGWAGSPETPIDEAVSRVRNECGFDLDAPFTAATTRATLEVTKGGGFRAQFDVKPNKWTQKARVYVVFNCAAPVSRKLGAGAPIVEGGGRDRADVFQGASAAAVIESEDAGGRYARHISLERPVIAKNWHGTAAYVDSLFGDGRRSPLSLLLACDSAMSRSCIEINVEPPTRLNGKRLEPLLELVRRIGHSPL